MATNVPDCSPSYAYSEEECPEDGYGFTTAKRDEQELLVNPCFEDDIAIGWKGRGCEIERTDETAHNGSWSCKVTNR